MNRTMLIAFVAAFGLAACSKEETKPAPAAPITPAPATAPAPAGAAKGATEAPKAEIPKPEAGKDVKK